jgi:hypothetical protein
MNVENTENSWNDVKWLAISKIYDKKKLRTWLFQSALQRRNRKKTLKASEKCCGHVPAERQLSRVFLRVGQPSMPGRNR